MPRVKQFNQEEVVEKAVHLFWEKGFHATSMQDIVDTLGINRASIYDTFGSKRELFNLTIDRYKNQNVERVSNFLFRHSNIREGLHLLFESSIDEGLDKNKPNGCFIVNTTSELGDDPELNQKLVENKTAFEKIYFDYLKLGVEQSQVSPYKDLKEIASYLFTLQAGIKVISNLHQSREDLMKIVSTGLTVLN
ncbi:MAG: TetR/AcrR family transcriptional regulator [Flavobacteriales bacterium]|nr:TetR/AcrR family transcriptional regulator [Flavobacteriales bacterium]